MPIMINMCNAAAPDGVEPWHLRDLLYHRACSAEPMLPLMNRDRVRYYACPTSTCPLGLLPTSLIEGLVWAAYTNTNTYAVGLTDRTAWGTLLRMTVARIDLGHTVTDITIHSVDLHGGGERVAQTGAEA